MRPVRPVARVLRSRPRSGQGCRGCGSPNLPWRRPSPWRGLAWGDPVGRKGPVIKQLRPESWRPSLMIRRANPDHWPGGPNRRSPVRWRFQESLAELPFCQRLFPCFPWGYFGWPAALILPFIGETWADPRGEGWEYPRAGPGVRRRGWVLVQFFRGDGSAFLPLNEFVFDTSGSTCIEQGTLLLGFQWRESSPVPSSRAEKGVRPSPAQRRRQRENRRRCPGRRRWWARS